MALGIPQNNWQGLSAWGWKVQMSEDAGVQEAARER